MGYHSIVAVRIQHMYACLWCMGKGLNHFYENDPVGVILVLIDSLLRYFATLFICNLQSSTSTFFIDWDAPYMYMYMYLPAIWDGQNCNVLQYVKLKNAVTEMTGIKLFRGSAEFRGFLPPQGWSVRSMQITEKYHQFCLIKPDLIKQNWPVWEQL